MFGRFLSQYEVNENDLTLQIFTGSMPDTEKPGFGFSMAKLDYYSHDGTYMKDNTDKPI
jgi:hypothetical protein